MADSSTSQLEQNSRDTVVKQQEGKQAAGAELRALAVAAQASITDAAEKACVKVDTETAQASKQLAGVVRRFAQKLQGHGPAKERSRQAANAQVVTAVAQFGAALDDLVARVGAALGQAAGQAAPKAQATVNELAGDGQKRRTGFQTRHQHNKPSWA